MGAVQELLLPVVLCCGAGEGQQSSFLGFIRLRPAAVQ